SADDTIGEPASAEPAASVASGPAIGWLPSKSLGSSAIRFLEFISHQQNKHDCAARQGSTGQKLCKSDRVAADRRNVRVGSSARRLRFENPRQRLGGVVNQRNHPVIVHPY